MGKKKRITGRFIRPPVFVSLLIIATFFISSYDNKCHPAPSQSPTSSSTHEKLVNYYTQMQSNLTGFDFVKSKVLNPRADFLQPWIAFDWKYEDYKIYLEQLKAQGMKYVVLQYVAKAEVVKGKAKLTENYFHLHDEDENPHLPAVYAKSTDDTFVSELDIVDNLFLAAEDLGMKVYLGTLWSEQWWNDEFKDAKWRAEILALEKILISYFITRYKNMLNMEDTFAGVYYTHEMYGNMLGYENHWNKMLGTIREHVYSQDPSLKFIASLFCSEYYLFDDSGGKTVEGKMQKFISDLFINNGKPVLKNGDIVSVQDKLATHPKTGVEYNAKFLHAVRDVLKVLATDHKTPLKYSIIVENFTPDFHLASADRYAQQILICSQLADELMVFSYSRYAMPKDKLNRPIKEGSKNGVLTTARSE